MSQLTIPQRRVLREIHASANGLLAKGGVDDGVAERLQKAGLVRLNQTRSSDGSRLWTWHLTPAGQSMVESP